MNRGRRGVLANMPYNRGRTKEGALVVTPFMGMSYNIVHGHMWMRKGRIFCNHAPYEGVRQEVSANAPYMGGKSELFSTHSCTGGKRENISKSSTCLGGKSQRVSETAPLMGVNKGRVSPITAYEEKRSESVSIVWS